MAVPVIVVGTSNFYDFTEDWAIFKYDSAGNFYQHGNKYPNHGHFLEKITACAIDAAGNIYVSAKNRYTAGSSGYDDQEAEWPDPTFTNFEYPQWTVRKYNPDGIVLWQYNHKAAVFDIVLDSSNNVIFIGDPVNDAGEVWDGGSRTGFYSVRKLNNDGVLQWSTDHGFDGGYGTSEYYVQPKITIDSSDNIYTSPYIIIGNNPKIVKYNSSGVMQWYTDDTHIDFVTDLIVDSSGNVYATGRFDDWPGDNKYNLIKYNSSGVYQSAIEPEVEGETYTGLIFDSAGDIIVLSTLNAGNANNPFIFKYDTDLVLLASGADYDSGIGPEYGSIAIDSDDIVYFTHRASLYKIDYATFGNLIWVRTSYDDDLSILLSHCVAVREVETPPLKIPLLLGTPSWIGDYYSTIPALPISLSLAIPTLLRDYIGRPLPSIYRAYLTGGTGTVEFIISSLSIRRNSAGVSVDIVVPGVTEADISAIESRTTGNIIIKRGIKFKDESEQIDELLSVPFSNFRYDGGSSSASIALYGYGEAETGHTKTRSVYGISYLNSNNGIRRIRCAVDTYLRVGDTADLGNAETLTVGEITITISTESAIMEILESATT